MHNLEVTTVVPFDLEEKVKVLNDHKNGYDKEVYIVKDILTIHSAKEGAVNFEIELKCESKSNEGFIINLLRGDKKTLITLDEYSKRINSKTPGTDKGGKEEFCGVVGNKNCSDCPERNDCYDR